MTPVEERLRTDLATLAETAPPAAATSAVVLARVAAGTASRGPVGRRSGGPARRWLVPVLAAAVVLVAVVGTVLAVGTRPAPHPAAASLPAAIRGVPWVLVEVNGHPAPVMLDDKATDYVGVRFGADSASVHTPCGDSTSVLTGGSREIRLSAPRTFCAVGGGADALFGTSFGYRVVGTVGLQLLDASGRPAFEFLRGGCTDPTAACTNPVAQSIPVSRFDGTSWRLVAHGRSPVPADSIHTLVFDQGATLTVGARCSVATDHLIDRAGVNDVVSVRTVVHGCPALLAPRGQQEMTVDSAVSAVIRSGVYLVFGGDDLAVYRPGATPLYYRRGSDTPR